MLFVTLALSIGSALAPQGAGAMLALQVVQPGPRSKWFDGIHAADDWAVEERFNRYGLHRE